MAEIRIHLNEQEVSLLQELTRAGSEGGGLTPSQIKQLVNLTDTLETSSSRNTYRSVPISYGESRSAPTTRTAG